MKTAPFVLTVVLAAACSDSTAPPASSLRPSFTNAASNGVIHRVSVGGSDQDATLNTDANFSLVAVQKADGSVQGEWSDQFGQGQGGVHVDVNCVFVQGNQAWISGIIRSGQAGGVDFTGLPAITRVADLGNSVNDAPDAISFTFIGVAAPCTAQPNLPLLAMTGGQVTVN